MIHCVVVPTLWQTSISPTRIEAKRPQVELMELLSSRQFVKSYIFPRTSTGYITHYHSSMQNRTNIRTLLHTLHNSLFGGIFAGQNPWSYS